MGAARGMLLAAGGQAPEGWLAGLEEDRLRDCREGCSLEGLWWPDENGFGQGGC